MSRTIRREVRKRGFFGWIFLIVFWGFNILMGAWMIAYWATIGERAPADSELEAAATFVGGTIGTGVIIFFWASGAVIFGLFVFLTRGRTTIIEEIER